MASIKTRRENSGHNRIELHAHVLVWKICAPQTGQRAIVEIVKCFPRDDNPSTTTQRREVRVCYAYAKPKRNHSELNDGPVSEDGWMIMITLHVCVCVCVVCRGRRTQRSITTSDRNRITSHGIPLRCRRPKPGQISFLCCSHCIYDGQHICISASVVLSKWLNHTSALHMTMSPNGPCVSPALAISAYPPPPHFWLPPQGQHSSDCVYNHNRNL